MEAGMKISLISLVVPAFNEGAHIFNNLVEILGALKYEAYQFELIVVDDGSVDNTAAEVLRLAGADERVRCISLTRNFGKEAAIHAGLAHAAGVAVIVLDGDLQHPPSLISQMLAFWRQGMYVVEAVKFDQPEQTGPNNRFLPNSFYALFQHFSGLDLRGHSDFKLLDRLVVDTYLALPEKCRFFRGIVTWLNYPSAQIPFSVPDRAGGSSQWNKLKLLAYAINNISSFSSTPLKLVSVLGLVILAFGAVMGVISLVQKFQGKSIDGFTTVNLLIIIIGGSILLSLGIIGHYIARIYDEVKARPPYMVRPSKKDE